MHGSGDVVHKRWVMKNVPELKEEIYTSTIRNHVSMIEFQLAEYRFNNVEKDVMGNWNNVSELLMKNENFGASVERYNGWLNDDMKTIVGTASNDLEKANKIYAYIRDNFTCNDYSSMYMDNPLRTVFKNRTGNVADLNLLLIAMLRQQDIKADPVLMSTRSNGFAHETYPLMERFNYVIAEMIISGKHYYLDASRPELGFAKLPVDCYNGAARVISTQPRPVYFFSDSLVEKKNTSVLIVNKDNGEMEGNVISTMGYNESLNIRRTIRDKRKNEFIKTLKSSYSSDIHLKEIEVDSLTNLEVPLQLKYNFVIDKNNQDIIYLDPIMSESYQSNILKAAERHYPVEMPYTRNETYVMSMEVPEGYVIDELPKSAKVSFNENVGFFEYIVVKTETSIQLKSRVVLKKANFAPEDYNSLRDFFSFIVKKYSEQIVFKKKK